MYNGRLNDLYDMLQEIDEFEANFQPCEIVTEMKNELLDEVKHIEGYIRHQVKELIKEESNGY